MGVSLIYTGDGPAAADAAWGACLHDRCGEECMYAMCNHKNTSKSLLQDGCVNFGVGRER